MKLTFVYGHCSTPFCTCCCLPFFGERKESDPTQQREKKLGSASFPRAQKRILERILNEWKNFFDQPEKCKLILVLCYLFEHKTFARLPHPCAVPRAIFITATAIDQHIDVRC